MLKNRRVAASMLQLDRLFERSKTIRHCLWSMRMADDLLPGVSVYIYGELFGNTFPSSHHPRWGRLCLVLYIIRDSMHTSRLTSIVEVKQNSLSSELCQTKEGRNHQLQSARQ